MSSSREIIRIGTRGSELALRQTRSVIRALSALDAAPPVEEVVITTSGDTIIDVPLARVPGRSFFTKEIEDALLDGTIDIAVHSLKDLATLLPDGLVIGAITTREDPREAFVSREGSTFDDLPAGSRIGTSSLRRRALIARARPDLELLDLRGNVPTRLQKLEIGDYDAIVVAVAGLRRLGLEQEITSILPIALFPPAPGQGAIALQIRRDDDFTDRLIAPLDHAPSRCTVTAERSLLRRLEGARFRSAPGRSWTRGSSSSRRSSVPPTAPA